MANTNARCSLEFAEVSSVHLTNLLCPFAFLQTAKRNNFVQFESQDVVVKCVHAERSYELAILVSMKDATEEEFELDDILVAYLGVGHGIPTFFQASTRTSIITCIMKICELLATYGDAALVGDREFYNKMRHASRARSRDLTTRVVCAPIREAAERAWEEKNYQEVGRLYTQIVDDLTNVERKRLEYVKKRSSNLK